MGSLSPVFVEALGQIIRTGGSEQPTTLEALASEIEEAQPGTRRQWSWQVSFLTSPKPERPRSVWGCRCFPPCAIIYDPGPASIDETAIRFVRTCLKAIVSTNDTSQEEHEIQRPAWSSPFSPGSLQQIETIGPIGQIDREWAWGGSTGRGVRVGVVDSGIEHDHPAVAGSVHGGCVIEFDHQLLENQVRIKPDEDRRRTSLATARPARNHPWPSPGS